MPVYEYVCRDCRKAFEIVRPISEAQATDVKCPVCGSHHVERTYSPDHGDPLVEVEQR